MQSSDNFLTSVKCQNQIFILENLKVYSHFINIWRVNCTFWYYVLESEMTHKTFCFICTLNLVKVDDNLIKLTTMNLALKNDLATNV